VEQIDRSSKIYVAGHRGMVGSAIVRVLRESGYERVLTQTREELDLTCQDSVRRYLCAEKPDFIFVAAAKVGGILANNVERADFLYENIIISANLIHGAHIANVDRLLFLGSSCIYPRDCPQPIQEEYLLTGPLELTNEPYAIAKIAGLKLAETYNFQHKRRYISVMPTNLYGPNDNFDLTSSHVLPALIRKAHEAKMRSDKSFPVWGSGTPRREFLHVDDLAQACVFLMETGYSGGILNIGCGEDVSIRKLAELVRDVVCFNGSIEFDPAMPDGTPRKVLDISKITNLGWRAKIGLREGIASVYSKYLLTIDI
jgi:GDP-L-fucose synthase